MRWLTRGAASAAGSDMPKSTWFRMICRMVVGIVDPPAAPTLKTGLPVPERDDRSHARPRLLAAGRQVRVGGPGRRRGEVEVGHLVVEQEAVAGHGLAAAAEEVDRVGERDDVAPLVGGDDVVGVAALRRQAAARPAPGRSAYGGYGLPGATGETSAVSPIRQRLVAANAGSSSPDSGTLT